MAIPHGALWKARMIFWSTLLVLTAWLLWYMVAVPGKSYSGPLPPLSDGESALRDNLQRHVFAVGGRERNLWQPAALEAAARYIEDALAGFGYTPLAQRFTTNGIAIRNIEVEMAGGARAAEVIIIGAHYDSVQGDRRQRQRLGGCGGARTGAPCAEPAARAHAALRAVRG